jgi:hypothetical protein
LRAWQGEAEEADVNADAGVGDGVDATAPTSPASAQADPAADLRWPCACGTSVEFDQDACPVCGSPFLGDLREGASGRHRGGAANGMFAHRWSSSRTFRFVTSGGIALLLAVGVPVLLALFG